MFQRLILLAASAIAVAAFVGVRQRTPADNARHAAAAIETGLRFERVALSTGVTLEVAEAGAAGGEPVVFLHGFPDSWYSYAPLLERLPAGMHAIVPSQRGYGDSDRPECCYRVADFAADVVALLDAKGIKEATIVGHSAGSFTAQRVAIEHPERVKRLVLIGSAAWAATAPVVEFVKTIEQLADPVDRELIYEFQTSTAARPLPPAFVDTIVDESSKVPARMWRAIVAGLVSPEGKNEVARIQAPTLVVWGEHDPLFSRAEQAALVSAIPGARLLVYEGLSHSPNWEDPARVMADIGQFVMAGAPQARASEPARHEAHGHALAREGPMPLLPGLGTWHMRITTTSPQAQRYFDQGLKLAYAFNHDEAARSFEEAVRNDSACALCYWGIAYAIGPNINLPMDPGVEPRAVAATRSAQRFASRSTPLEQALIAALARRFGEPAGAARGQRDSAYADAMRGVARRFPDDADAQVLFADALLNLRPWAQWTRDGRPQPGTNELVAALERALAGEPNHPGACHFYIHAVEASDTPERALPCAERLPRLMPGAGHVVHMPAHVYLRVGRYEDAARANIAAVASDDDYLATHKPASGIYPLFYAPHNLHFLWATYLLSGQRTKAVGTARTLAERVAVDDARANPALQAFLTAPALTLARFEDWSAVLREAAPAPELSYVKGMWHYARGLARAATGKPRFARFELDSVRAIGARVPKDMIIILNPADALLGLAADALAGAIAMSERRYTDAVSHFRSAVRREDALTYDEPPPWYHATRNMLGEALLAAGRAAEAEAAFREDLRFVRENGWSLDGLQRALLAQRKQREAARYAMRFKEAWKYADAPVN